MNDTALKDVKVIDLTQHIKTDKGTIAAVNGYAVAGGLERALACNTRIASENAQFGCFEIRRALPNPPDPLIRLVGFGPALHMLLSGELIDAHEAPCIGLVAKVVSAQKFIPTVEDLTGRIGNTPRRFWWPPRRRPSSGETWPRNDHICTPGRFRSHSETLTPAEKV